MRNTLREPLTPLDAAERAALFAVRGAAVMGLVDQLDRATVLALTADRIRTLAEDAAARAVDEGASYGEVGRALRISRAAAHRRFRHLRPADEVA